MQFGAQITIEYAQLKVMTFGAQVLQILRDTVLIHLLVYRLLKSYLLMFQ